MRKIGPEVSVIMPIYNQASFLSRAMEGLKAQSLDDWELIIINDGSTDHTDEIIKHFLKDTRISYFKNPTNEGLGNALNMGLDLAQGKYIAYLPSDDIYYSNHLMSLYLLLKTDSQVILAYSGLRHHYNRYSTGILNDWPQLVQVMHRRTDKRWVAREELVTDDLNFMFWDRLKDEGDFIGTEIISCEWVNHPEQRHKKILEPEGGINPYRSYYKVNQPLRFKSSVGNFIDEYEKYANFRKPRELSSTKGLTILLVGELAYNPERILALEERGHRLYGLWTQKPHWFNYVGPLPFGNIETLDVDHWKEQIEAIKPDIIYGLLNWQAVPFAHKILTEKTNIPFVWNFKEGPFICLEKGYWKELIELYTYSDGQIYTSPEMKEWFKGFLPEYEDQNTIILDGDLPKKDWFFQKRSTLLSDSDGEIHTVVPGRPIGLHPHVVADLARQKIHLHFYGDYTQGQWKEWIEETMLLAPGYLHTHVNVDQKYWVEEFSQYDAGWLHTFESQNFGEIRRANWDDLNYPARIATLALSGVPFLQRDNSGHIVATQALIEKHDIGILFKNIQDLSDQLHDKQRMSRLRENIWRKRSLFTFDHHADFLIEYFRSIIEKNKFTTLELNFPMIYASQPFIPL